MRIKFGLFISLSLLMGSAPWSGALAEEEQGSPKKVWACAARGTSDEDLFLVEWGHRSYVKLYDVRIWGSFNAEEDDKRWNFGEGPGNTAAFSAVMNPQGEVDYYDFRQARPGESVPPSYFYNCRLAQQG